jgi:DUF1680 family protein
MNNRFLKCFFAFRSFHHEASMCRLRVNNSLPWGWIATLGLAVSGPALLLAAAPATPVADMIQPATPREVGGILGERLFLWRGVRLWRVGGDPFLLSGFIQPPGTHPWQGEHVGKWLHAASLAFAATGDAREGEAVRRIAAQLVATQGADGYLGTYSEAERFSNQLATGDPKSWDIWTNRYAIQGLLAYHDVVEDAAALNACRKAGDLLVATVGPPDGDLTKFGTRYGLSSGVLLESISLLYQRTGDPRYLELARHIVVCLERHPNVRISAAMRAGEDVTVCGDGKAYQLMAVLLGYVELYRATGEKPLLDTAVTAWERIRADHVNRAGGPWGYQVERGTNQECFAPRAYFHPTNCVETCSTTTWIQLSLALFEITGESRYANAAEVAVLNHLLGAQSPDGNRWAYHSMLNMPDRGYDDAITCCGSSGPRALEEYGRRLVYRAADRVVLNGYLPCMVPLEGEKGLIGELVVEGGYPLVPACSVRLELAGPAEFALDFRIPTGVAGIDLTVNGSPQQAKQTEPGFLRVQRQWQPGDRITVEFDFTLSSHFQTANDGLRWAAFSWGPLVLAQTVALQTDQPEIVLVVPEESPDGSRWLTLQRAVVAAKQMAVTAETIEELDTSRPTAAPVATVPTWRLASPRKVILMPYFLAGSTGGGVRGMFPTRPDPVENP